MRHQLKRCERDIDVLRNLSVILNVIYNREFKIDQKWFFFSWNSCNRVSCIYLYLWDIIPLSAYYYVGVHTLRIIGWNRFYLTRTGTDRVASPTSAWIHRRAVCWGIPFGRYGCLQAHHYRRADGVRGRHQWHLGPSSRWGWCNAQSEVVCCRGWLADGSVAPIGGNG